MTAKRFAIRYRSVAITIARGSFDPGDTFNGDHAAHIKDLVDHLCEDEIVNYVLDPARPKRLQSLESALDQVLHDYAVRDMIAPLERSAAAPGTYLFAVRDDPAEDDPSRQLRARLRLHEHMLSFLRATHPTDFERLCGKILDHIGCTQVHVTRSSVDLGADFMGRRPAASGAASGLAVPAARRVLSSASQLLFGQAKRYAQDSKIDQDTIKLVESTWTDIVRRKQNGVLPAHLDAGLSDIGWQAGDAPIWMFATTSSYTPAAMNYAVAAQMQTLDGDQLAQLMLQDALGVKQDPVTGDWSTDGPTVAAFCV